MSKLKESDLYQPVKNLLTSQGFMVKGEVKGCDVTAAKGEDLWVVEMKLSFNMTLLMQAMDRLTLTDFVFVAFPRPKRGGMKNFRTAEKILTKLGLGLIMVSADLAEPTAEIIIFPGGTKANKRNKKARAVKNEMGKRIGDTPGGVTKTKISTVYRERCIRIACVLEAHGEKTARDFKGDARIFRENVYGWLKKTEGGGFILSKEGKEYLEANKDNSAVIYYRLKAKE